MTNKNTIKKLLAAASTVAILASGSSALATDFIISGGDGATALGTNIRSAAGAAPQAVGDGNHTIFLNGANDLTLSQATSGANTHTINLYGTDARTLNLSAAGKFAITNAVAVADIAAAGLANGGGIGAGIVVAPTVNLAFTGVFAKTLTAGSNLVNQVDFGNNAAASLTLTDAANNLAGALLGTGQLIVTNGVTTGALAINNGATITVQNGATLGDTTFTGGAVAAANVVAGGAVGNVATLGAITVTDQGTVTINDYVTGAGNITVTTANSNLAINGANSTIATVTLNGATTAAKNTLTAGTITNLQVDNAAAGFTLAGGTITTVTSAVANNGTINVTGDATIGQLGDNAAVGTVNFGATSIVKLATGGTTHKVNAVTASEGATGTFAFTAIDQIFIYSGAALASNFVGTANVGGGATHSGSVTFTKGAAVTTSGTFTGISNVKIAAANTKVDFASNLVSVEKLDFTTADAGMSATIISAGNSQFNTPLQIDNSGGAADASVTLNNTAAQTLGTIGATNALPTLTLNGTADVNVATAKTATITNVVFGTNAAGTTFTVDTLDNITDFTTLSATNGGTVSFRNASTLAGKFGNTGNTLTALNYVGTVDATLTVNNKNLFGANITATTDGKLTVDTIGANAIDNSVGTIGSATATAKAVNFTGAGAANTLTVGNMWTASAKLLAVGKFAFSNVTGVQTQGVNATFDLGGFGSTVTFTNSTITNTDLTNATGAILTFADNTVVGKVGTNAAAAASITFSGGAGMVQTLGGDLFATALNFGEGSYTPTADLKVTGPVALTAAATLNVGAQDTTLTFADAITNDAAALTVQFSSDVDGVYGAVSGTTVSKVANLNATINPLASYAKDGTVVTNVITLTGTDLSSFNHKLIGSNNLMDWKLVQGSDQYHLDIQATQDVARLATAVAKAGGNSKSQALVNRLEGSTGNAEKFLEVLGNSSSEIAAEASNRMTAEASTAGHVTAATSDNQDTFAQRLNIVSSATGVSSGSESSMMNLGVWAQVNGAKTTQKAKKLDSGFTANGNGLTVGVDTKLADMTTIGIAATQSSSTLKFKNTKSGDKAKSTSTFFNLYARHELANDWFVQGIAGFGQGSIKATDKRVATAQTYDTATAKYDTMSYSLDVTTGYTYKVAETTALVPTVGLRYISVNEGGYTETGSAFNRTVTKKASDVLSGVFGGYVKQDVDMSGTTALVEAHAFGNYDFTNKNAKVSAKLDGLSGTFDISPSKQNKFSYNLGVSANARMEMVEYGIGYDAKLADKFVSHQGTLRLRVDL